jgi:hypothetical protein
MGFFDKPIVANENEANTRGDYTPIPEGVYNLVIEKSEISKTKANNDKLSLTFRVDDGEYERRKLFTNLNLENNNTAAVELAKKQLHALLILCGLKELEHPDDLIGQSLSAKVVVKKRKDTGQLQNEVLLSIKKGEAVTPHTPKPQATADTAPRPVTNKSKW